MWVRLKQTPPWQKGCQELVDLVFLPGPHLEADLPAARLDPQMAGEEDWT